MNIEIAKQILMSSEEYWLFEKNEGGIFMASIPHNIRRGMSYGDILLSDIEKLFSVPFICNIFLNQSYSPFQLGQFLDEIVRAYPITSNANAFMKAALNLDSQNIMDYLDILEKTSKKS